MKKLILFALIISACRVSDPSTRGISAPESAQIMDCVRSCLATVSPTTAQADVGGKRITLANGNDAIKTAGWGDGNQVVDPMLDVSNQTTAQTQSGVGPTMSRRERCF